MPNHVYGGITSPPPTYGITRHLETPPGRVPRNDASMVFRLLLEAAAGRPETNLDALLAGWARRADERTRAEVADACDQLSALCRQQKG